MNRPHPLYWPTQTLGWAAVLGTFYGLAAATGGVASDWTVAEALVSTVGVWAALVAASHAMRALVLRWRDAGALGLGARLAVSALALGVLVQAALIALGTVQRVVQGGPSEWTPEALVPAVGSAVITGGMLMAWTLAYVLVTTAGRLRQAEREALGLRAALAEAELAALRAQINPHFLFNALNTVRALIAVDPAAARGAVTGLSTILRGTLTAGQSDTHALSAELALVGAYLDLERLRFEERLGVDVEVPAEALGVAVPALAVLTLVENAVKHGVADRPDGGTVRLWARLDAGRLRLAVENPPAPHGARADGTGSGLRLVRERLGLLYGDAADLRVEMGDPVRVEITLPADP